MRDGDSMLLAIDIGNTNTVVGGIRDDAVIFTARIDSDSKLSTEEYAKSIGDVLILNGVKTADIEGVIISSVVPEIKKIISECSEAMFNIKPFVAGGSLKTGLYTKKVNASKVGTDRIVTAAAAYYEYKMPIILMDLGTATTVDAVGADGCYLGGCIIPGVNIALKALIEHTAQLPEIELEAPECVIGANTVECMQSGMIYGTASMLDGLIEKISSEMKEKPKVIATGGLAELIIPHCNTDIIIDDDLMLKGLNIIYKLNKE